MNWPAVDLGSGFPFDEVPRYLLRDRDRTFGADFTQEVGHLGIEEALSAPRLPWQRAYIERVIGSIPTRLGRTYRWKRTHGNSLGATAGLGPVVGLPQVGGLHHRYERRAA
jgi:putative transposase